MRQDPIGGCEEVKSSIFVGVIDQNATVNKNRAL